MVKGGEQMIIGCDIDGVLADVSHTVLVPKTLVFRKETTKCHSCDEVIEKHIVCEGARFHVKHWDSNRPHCSAPDCEVNHQSICRKR